MKTTVAVYDTKPYDRESFARVAGADAIDWRFLEFRLGPEHRPRGARCTGRLRVRERRSRPRGAGGARGAGGSLAGAAVYRLQQGGPARGEGTGPAGDARAELLAVLGGRAHGRADPRLEPQTPPRLRPGPGAQLLARGARGLRPPRQDRRRHRHGQDRSHRGRTPEGLRDAGVRLRCLSGPGVGSPARDRLHGPADARERE